MNNNEDELWKAAEEWIADETATNRQALLEAAKAEIFIKENAVLRKNVFDAAKTFPFDIIKARQDTARQMVAVAGAAIGAYVALYNQWAKDTQAKNPHLRIEPEKYDLVPIVLFVLAAGIYLGATKPPFEYKIQDYLEGNFEPNPENFILRKLNEIYWYSARAFFIGGGWMLLGIFSGIWRIWFRCDFNWFWIIVIVASLCGLWGCMDYGCRKSSEEGEGFKDKCFKDKACG